MTSILRRPPPARRILPVSAGRSDVRPSSSAVPLAMVDRDMPVKLARRFTPPQRHGPFRHKEPRLGLIQRAQGSEPPSIGVRN